MIKDLDEAVKPGIRPRADISRERVIQGFLDLFEDARYLEVGVSKGLTFNKLRARVKHAVDPKFRFDYEAVAAADPASKFHKMPSDEYFGEIARVDQQFDVIYLDGLHTVEQTLRDLINAVSFLASDGVIIIDDVYPPSYAASLPDLMDFFKVKEALDIKSGAWMGDVYRLVYIVQTFFQQFSYRSIANNHGQLVMWRQPRPAKQIPHRKIAEAGTMPYERIVLDRTPFNFANFADILSEYKKFAAK